MANKYRVKWKLRQSALVEAENIDEAIKMVENNSIPKYSITDDMVEDIEVEEDFL
jgi:hypothetical protein